MSVYLSQDNLTKIVQLPCMPGAVSFNNGSQTKTISLINLGQGSIIGRKVLESLSIESWLPGENEISGLTDYKPAEKPQFYIDAIKEFKNNGKPTRLTVTDMDLSILVSIEGFDYTLAGGSGEYEYTLSLLEYVDPTVKVATAITVSLNVSDTTTKTSAPVANTSRPVDKVAPKSVTVVSGESLWKIAKRELGNGARYTDIATLNNIVTPYTIFPGQVVILPE